MATGMAGSALILCTMIIRPLSHEVINMKTFLIPQPVRILVSLLPRYPHSLIFTRVVNLALGSKLHDEVWQPLHGKRICIRVKDEGVAFHFTLGAHGMIARRAAAQPDLAISASAQDFFLLALRKEDPDTLFFSRRQIGR